MNQENLKEVQHIRISEGTVHIGGEQVFSHPVKELEAFSRELYRAFRISYSKFYKMSPLSMLGFLASELILREVDLSNMDPADVSLVLANSSSSLHTDKIYQESIDHTPSPAIFVYTLPNIMIGEICIRNGFKGEGVFFIQERYDRESILEYASGLIASGNSTCCLAGWVEVDMEGGYLAELSLLMQIPYKTD
jgi:hypothetical protein